MRNCTTDLMESQMTMAFLKSGLTTAEFVQHIIDTREPISASVTKEYASIEVAIDMGCDMSEVFSFYKHHDSNHWGCKV